MATPNYSYEKRQRELAKKRKAEEKRMRKQQRSEGPEGEAPADDTGAANDVDGEASSTQDPE